MPATLRAPTPSIRRPAGTNEQEASHFRLADERARGHGRPSSPLGSGPNTSPIQGIGDQAYGSTGQTGTAFVAAKKGNVAVYVSVTNKVAGGFASPLDAAEAIATALLTAVGQ